MFRAEGVRADRLVRRRDLELPRRGAGGMEPFPVTFTAQWRKSQGLRYGENPHQAAAFYADTALPDEPTLGARSSCRGRSSTTTSSTSTRRCARPRIRHPRRGRHQAHESLRVGVSKRRLLDAFKKARECDLVSAYGGVIGFNRPVNSETAREIANTFFEAIIAPPTTRRRGRSSGKEEPPRAGHGRRVPVVGRPDVRDQAGERRAAPCRRATGTCSTRRTSRW